MCVSTAAVIFRFSSVASSSYRSISRKGSITIASPEAWHPMRYEYCASFLSNICLKNITVLYKVYRLVWKFRSKCSIYPGTQKSAGNGDDEDSKTCSCQGKHGTRTSSGQRPTQTKQGAPCQIASHLGGILGCHCNRIAFNILDTPSFYELDRDHRYDNGQPDDAIHVDRVEAKHLLNTKPGDDFRLDHYKAEKNPDQQVLEIGSHK